MNTIHSYEILYSSVLEKHISEKVVSVILKLEEIGECVVYLHAETDNDGNRKVRGVIKLQEKRYECIIKQGLSVHGVLLIIPLDDGSYNNMNSSIGRSSNEPN